MRLAGSVSYVFLLLISAAWLTLAALLPPSGSRTPEKVSFSRDILPILSDKCFKCHGPDATGRQANLRLDSAEGAFADRGGKWAIVPGKPASSLVVQRINHPTSPMPPSYSGKTLTKQEIGLITRWISEGAHYGKMWSLEPVAKVVPVPNVKSNWPRSDLDRFIIARLTKEGLAPSKAASPLRWLRRVTLDLTGLPPTEEEIASFQFDKRPDSCERVVDRLLASPHFGERVAVDWLDAARYSDSYGYQSDLLMPTWPYRDWVVRSFNQNLPYNEFLTEQIAGDLLKNPTRDQRLATAFNRLHRQSNEGGSIALEFKTEYAVDRTDTFGSAVLGLTVGCARCHDHKFDPITQREYYQLFAYFNSIDEYGLLLSTEIVPTPSLLLPTPEQEKRLKELRSQDEAVRQNLSKAIARSSGRYQDWLARGTHPEHVPGIIAHFSLDNFDSGKSSSDVGKAMADKLGKVDLVEGHSGKAVQFDGDNGLALRGLPAKERWDHFTWSFWIQDPRQRQPVVLLHRTGGTDVGFCGFDLMLEDGFLTARVMRHWPGNAVAVRTSNRIPKNAWTHVGWSWDGSGRAAGLKLYVDGKPAPIEVLNNKLWKKIDAYGDLGTGGDWAFAQRFRDAGFKGGKLDEVTFVDRALSSTEVEQLFNGKPLAATKGFYDSAVDEQVKAAELAVRKSQQALAEYEEGVYEISVMEEAPKEIPAYLLARGRYDAPRNEKTRVVRGVPKSLPPLGASGKNDRLALAKWATRSDNPLTARVAVNRLWQMIFGVGLVETSENFGMQGSQPTHPELLDYLSRRFMDSGWNVKKLLREIVLSSTYRQDSARSPKLNAVDPDNRLYARGPSRRLTAEMVRDTALAASGLLNPAIGGRPVNPYQPAGIWQENNTMSPPFVQSKGPDLYRRSLYSTWKRTTPVPSMMLFDATSREACTIRRPSTDTPLQALVLLNDVQFIEAARVLAEFVMKKQPSDSDRIKLAFVRLAGREPDPRELAVLLETLNEQRTQFASGTQVAEKLLAVGASKVSPGLDARELASMTVVVQTILNSDAVIWKR